MCESRKISNLTFEISGHTWSHTSGKVIHQT